MANKFVISEREKNRILNLHTEKMLLERQGDATTATTTATTATTTPTTATTITTNPLAGRWDTAVCPSNVKNCDVLSLKRQMKINDFCDPKILNSTLESIPKGKTGQPGSYRLLEDGVIGNTTKTVYNSCKGSIDVKVANLKATGGGGTGTGTAPQTIPVGGNLTANDIQTLIA